MPRFSVVIPTLNRHETLAATLRTCLSQDHDSYEIVVCDNASSPETRQVVEEFGRKEIKYVRSDKPLAMSANWELALSHAKGEYVTFIGDDDALMPGALSALDRYSRQAGNVNLFRWERVDYNWPKNPILGYSNLLTIHFQFGSHVFESEKFLKTVSSYPFGWKSLPMLYNSAVHQDLISQVIKKTGRFFESRIPDVYSGFALAHVAKRFASLGVHLGVDAMSPKSNGANFIASGDKSEIAQNFLRANDEAGYRFHEKVPALPGVVSALADPHCWAHQLIFPERTDLAPDLRKILEASVNEVFSNDLLFPNRASYLEQIRAKANGDGSLKAWLKYIIERAERKAASVGGGIEPAQSGIRFGALKIDASQFNVSDVEGAAQLGHKLLGPPPEALIYNDPAEVVGYQTLRERTQLAWGRLRAVGRAFLRGT
jgi:glycosyltransferase involved in cell wall biosynthesis